MHNNTSVEIIWNDNDNQPLPKLLMGDVRRFKQVLINLVKNALKFTRRGYIKILTSYDTQAEMLHAQINDTGVGIAQEDLGKLFN